MPERYQGASPNAHFLAGELAPPQIRSRWANGLSVSVVTHGLAVLIALIVAMQLPGVGAPKQAEPVTKYDIIWTPQPGPGGGGGGGGNQQLEPPRKAELPGKQKITVPAAKPPKVEPLPKPQDTPPKPQELNIPAQLTSTGVQQLPGVIANATVDTSSLGKGTGTGAGGGAGSGAGAGSGSGLGEGSGGGTGGGVFRLGSGITNPEPTYSPRPNYTADAMRAKVQGVVGLEAVVLPNGSVGDVKITRSLDPHFGLDMEAIRTVKSWRFRPAKRNGEPVAVWVDVELTFTLR